MRACIIVVMGVAACGSDSAGSVADGAPDSVAPDDAADSVATADGADDKDVTNSPDIADANDIGADIAVPVCPSDCTVDCPQGCFTLAACDAPNLETHVDVTPGTETAGFYVRATADLGPVHLYYRLVGVATWWRGQDPVPFGLDFMTGVVFGLEPDHDYELRLQVEGEYSVCGTFTTLAIDPPNVVARTLHVTPIGGADADYHSIAEAVAAATAGTDILVAAGVYRESVPVEVNGEVDAYVRIIGLPGAILDGADPDVEADGLAWVSDGDDVYHVAWDGAPGYLARDAARSYHYPSLDALQAGLGDDDVPMAEGWFVEDGQLYVRSADDPDAHTWHIPVLNTAFALDGAERIWIEGFEIRHFGDGEYAKGVDIRGGSDIVVRKNVIHDTPSPIWVRREGRDVRIEDNEIYQSSVFEWPWDAVKGTDHENSAISLQGGNGALVRGNRIHDIFNGIYAGDFDDDSPDIASNVDVNHNAMWNIGDDGLEPEGACVLHRYWQNTIDRMQNGISLAPILVGPVYAVRNRMSDYRESGFKVSNDSTGRVFLFHNTSWVGAAEHNGMNVSGPFEHITFRNNIVAGTFYAIEMSLETGPNDLDYDLLHTTRGAPIIKWQDVRYDSLVDLCAATGLECHGSDAAPALTDPSHGVLMPTVDSPAVDSGVRLYGINDDFAGDGPDMGYVERGAVEPPPR